MSLTPVLNTGAANTTAADYAANHEIPQAALKTDLRTCRPEIVGPDAPSQPFPIPLAGPVQKGFGRGGKDLGCPTGLSWMFFLVRILIQLQPTCLTNPLLL
jgi:hypothetical protein